MVKDIDKTRKVTIIIIEYLFYFGKVSFDMFFPIPVFLDGQSWHHLKSLAGDDLTSGRNYLQLLIQREWEARQALSDGKRPKLVTPGVAPSIPGIYHIRQDK